MKPDQIQAYQMQIISIIGNNRRLEMVMWNGDSYHTSEHSMLVKGTIPELCDILDLCGKKFDDADFRII